MKFLIITILSLTSLSAFSADTFKDIYRCEMVEKINEMKITISKSSKGNFKMVLEPEGSEKIVVKAKEILPPRMMAGGALKYEAKDPESQGLITLSIFSRPIKVGSVTGKSAKISMQGLFSDLAMVCKGL